MTSAKTSLFNTTTVLLGIGLLIAVWWATALALGPARLPTPPAQLSAIFELVTYSPILASQPGSTGSIIPDLLATFSRALFGVAVGCLFGVVVGLLLGGIQRLRYFVELPLEALRVIPPLAIAPFFLMWFGPSVETQVGTLALFAFLRVVVNAIEAQRNVLPQLRQYAQTLGANRRQMFTGIVAPAIFPELIGAFRVTLASGWGLQIVTELLGTPSGVGRVLVYLVPLLRPDLIIAVIFWMTLLAVLIDTVLFRFVAVRLTRWVPRARA